jgi:hypothetical protein
MRDVFELSYRLFDAPAGVLAYVAFVVDDVGDRRVGYSTILGDILDIRHGGFGFTPLHQTFI